MECTAALRVRFVREVDRGDNDDDSDDHQVRPHHNGRPHRVHLLRLALERQKDGDLLDGAVLGWVGHVLVLHPEQSPLASAQDLQRPRDCLGGLRAKPRLRVIFVLVLYCFIVPSLFSLVWLFLDGFECLAV